MRSLISALTVLLLTTAAGAADWVFEDAGVPIGTDSFAFIAAPCAVETREQTLEAAAMARAAGAGPSTG